MSVRLHRARTEALAVHPLLGALGKAMAVLVVVLVGWAWTASPAGAHTGFESSDPSDGTTVEGPVEQITVRFTGPAEPAGEGFVVLDGDGVEHRPAPEGSEDRRVWTLRFAEPLGGGSVGVRWMVQAPDAHPIDGSFAFEVETADPPAATEGTPAVSSEAGPSAGDDLESFLAGDDRPSVDTGERIATVGRTLGIAGTVLGVGALVFAAFVLRASPGDVRHVLFWVRRAGALVVLGALVRLAGRVLIDAGGSWSAVTSPSQIADTIQSTTGAAIVLRLVGGVLLLVGCRLGWREADAEADTLVRGHELVTAGVARARGPRPSPPVDPRRTVPGSVSWRAGGGLVAWIGAGLLLVGYLFDGHTVTEGNRVVTAVTDVVHVAAGAVWAGGLAMLVSVLRRRHRRGEDLMALHLAARFSVVAAAALVAVALSGLVMAVVVLDQVSELWSTPWGRTLSAKTAAVVVAASLGAYNHWVLIPTMEAASAADPQASDGHARRLRTVATAEAVALGVVVVLTAVLVGAAT